MVGSRQLSCTLDLLESSWQTPPSPPGVSFLALTGSRPSGRSFVTEVCSDKNKSHKSEDGCECETSHVWFLTEAGFKDHKSTAICGKSDR